MAAGASVVLLALVTFTIVNLSTSKEYYIEKDNNNFLNWYQAHVECVKRGYRGLATASTWEKERELTQAIDNGGPYQGDYFWIGLTDLGKNGKYVWFNTGEEAKYFNWAHEQGKPSRGWNQHCIAVIKLNNQWLWYDDDCDGRFKFVCEK